MKRRAISTLMVGIGKVINLTDTNLTFYDMDGNIVSARPRMIQLNAGGFLPKPDKDTYYIVDNSTKVLKELESDRRYFGWLLEPFFTGKGSDGINIYHLSTRVSHTRVLLCRSDCVCEGSVIDSYR